MIATLENSLGKNSEDDERIREEIKTLVLHKDYVMKNPDTLGMNASNILWKRGWILCNLHFLKCKKANVHWK